MNKKMVTVAMLIAMAHVINIFVRIPIMPTATFLDYTAKEIIIIIGGFMFGPAAALSMSVILALLQYFLISGGTGPIGVVMNILSSAALAVTASYIYSMYRSIKGAVIGLAAGVFLMVAVMLLWNYILVPIYTGLPREFVVPMLLPIFLPFNLISGSLNSAIAMMLYKPITLALEKAKLRVSDTPIENRRLNIRVLFVSGFVILTFILVILAIQGII